MILACWEPFSKYTQDFNLKTGLAPTWNQTEGGTWSQTFVQLPKRNCVLQGPFQLCKWFVVWIPIHDDTSLFLLPINGLIFTSNPTFFHWMNQFVNLFDSIYQVYRYIIYLDRFDTNNFKFQIPKNRRQSFMGKTTCDFHLTCSRVKPIG